MRVKLLFAGSLILMMTISAPGFGAPVTITFDSDLEGFVATSGTAVWDAASESVSIAQGDDWQNNQAEFQIQSNGSFRAEFEAAVANGGTLSFDLTIQASDYDPNDSPSYFEIILNPNTELDGFGDNVFVSPGFNFGTLQADGSQTSAIVLDMSVFGTDYDGLSGSGYGNIHFGTNTQGGAFAGDVVTFYVDNLRIEAIPEPTTMTLVGLAIPAILAAGRRRKE